MLIKIKYVGSDEAGLTVDQIYVALAIVDAGGDPAAIVINDSGVPYVTKTIANTDRWELVSVETIGAVSIYP